MRSMLTVLVFGVAIVAAPAQDTWFNFGSNAVPLSPVPGAYPAEFGNPFSTAYSCTSLQYIFTAADLQAQGVAPGRRLAITRMTALAALGLHWNEVSIWVKHTDRAYYSPPPGIPPQFVARETGLQPLYLPSTHEDYLGPNDFSSQVPFYWNGVDSIVLEFNVLFGCAEYPSGTPGWAAVGPTLAGTTWPSPNGPNTFKACAGWSDSQYGFTGCTEVLCRGVETPPDLRLHFRDDAVNDHLGSAYLLTEGTYLQTNQNASSSLLLSGIEDDVWYLVENLGPAPLAYTVSGCGGPNGFDTAIAVFRVVGPFYTPLVATDDDGCGTPGGPFSVTFEVQPGENFYLAVGRSAGAPITGDHTFTISLSTASYASTVTTGPGCGFAGAAPPLLSGTAPHLGSVGTISLTGAPPISVVVLFLGPPAPGGTLLGTACPFHLDFAFSFVMALALTDAVGAWSYSDVLPSATELVGVSVALQAALVSPQHSPPIGTSNAITLTFGV